MIRHTRQRWQVGEQVRVGFLTLIVKAAIATPGDYAPDAYFLTNLAGEKLYEFVPHHGLRAVSAAEAAERLAESRARRERLTAQELARVAKASRARSEIEAVFAGGAG